MPGKPKLIKVCLANEGRDVETPWAHDLGPARGPKGSRKARLVNVPFMHAKPTWGDVIVVRPEDGFMLWDREGVTFAKIGTRILEDGGRWAMIVDYTPNGRADAYKQLAEACAELDIVCEGALAPEPKRPGRAYLAVPSPLTDVAVMTKLRAAKLSCQLAQVHPKPAAPKPAAKKKRRKA